jgi:peroxiredoxin
MGAMGPSSDPIGGQLDLSDEVVKGAPDTLTDLHVRFVDFQGDLILSEAFANGRIDSSTYNYWRDRTRHVDLPQEPIDQHVHYAIGRNRSGDFVIIFDTDNDEDLSDEKGALFPWQGEAIDFREFFADLKGVSWLRVVGSMPQFSVAVQLFDGSRVHDSHVILSVIPHLKASRITGESGETAEHPTYMIGALRNMVGKTVVDGVDYTFWIGTRGLGVYHPRDAQIWFEEGDQRDAEIDSTNHLAVNPYLIGQVIDLNGQFYRLDDVSPDGSELRLVAVDNMPGVGIRPEMEAPEFRGVTIEGDAVKLSDFRGKYVLLDFWATGCGPCIENLPELKKVYSEFAGDSFEIIGIAEDDPAWLSQFVTDNGIGWSQITQNRQVDGQGTIIKDYGVTGIPTYFLIDPAGKVVDPALGIRPAQLDSTLRGLGLVSAHN